MIKIRHDFKKNLKYKLGKHCFIYRGRAMEKIKKRLGRENMNLCLKVFYDHDKIGNWGDDPKKGGIKRNTTVKEATLIQNICWYHGLAPRVYSIEEIEWNGKKCLAQVTEDLGLPYDINADFEKKYQKVIDLGKGYGWDVNYKECKQADIMQGKLVDFQTFNLSSNSQEKLANKYREFGTYGKKYYHNVPELGLTGSPRENEERVKWLGLDQIDWKGKGYADLGCANGWFTRYVDMMGAKRVTGFDTKQDAMKDPLLSAWIAANVCGQYNIDYEEKNFKIVEYVRDNEEFDVATFLSMTYHVGVPGWLNQIANLVIVEDNSKIRDAGSHLERLFKKVELKGYTEDRGNSHLPIYWCYR